MKFIRCEKRDSSYDEEIRPPTLASNRTRPFSVMRSVVPSSRVEGTTKRPEDVLRRSRSLWRVSRACEYECSKRNLLKWRCVYTKAHFVQTAHHPEIKECPFDYKVGIRIVSIFMLFVKRLDIQLTQLFLFHTNHPPLNIPFQADNLPE